MSTQPDRPNTTAPILFRRIGFWAVLSGAAALVLVFVQIAGPSLEPSPSVATQVGEMAGEIKRAAWRSFFGLPQPEPEPQAVPVRNYLALAAPILGVVAVVLSLVSAIARENWRFPVYGTSLGAAAIVFHYFWWVALLIAGVVLLVAILENLGDIFSF